MGYYSYYSLKVIPSDNRYAEQSIIYELRQENPEAQLSFDEHGETVNENIWENYIAEMMEFSKKYQDVVFIILRRGQLMGDISKNYFKNGEYTEFVGEMTYPYVDDSLLEEYALVSSDPSPSVDPTNCKFNLMCSSYMMILPPEQSIALIQSLRALYTEAQTVMDEQGVFFEETYWQNHEIDLIDFSKRHPSIRFTLNRLEKNGYESYNMNDLSNYCRKIFKNGKIHRSNPIWCFHDEDFFIDDEDFDDEFDVEDDD